MRPSIKSVLVLAAFSGLAILPACSSTSGSSSAKTTATETSTITGRSTMTASVGLDSAYAAAKDAISELQFVQTQDNKDALTAVLKAKTADNKTVTVTLTRKSDTITDVEVDAGVIDRSLAQKTLDTIRRKIGG
ncbi:MAG TPA: DUF3568 family protein [Phycisphaerales bacterium]|nr:DUF3568 family protein [Phycisphaerales bacterium]